MKNTVKFIPKPNLKLNKTMVLPDRQSPLNTSKSSQNLLLPSMKIPEDSIIPPRQSQSKPSHPLTQGAILLPFLTNKILELRIKEPSNLKMKRAHNPATRLTKEINQEWDMIRLIDLLQYKHIFIIHYMYICYNIKLDSLIFKTL